MYLNNCQTSFEQHQTWTVGTFNTFCDLAVVLRYFSVCESRFGLVSGSAAEFQQLLAALWIHFEIVCDGQVSAKVTFSMRMESMDFGRMAKSETHLTGLSA